MIYDSYLYEREIPISVRLFDKLNKKLHEFQMGQGIQEWTK